MRLSEMAARGSISISVLKRILIALDGHGTAINRTNLAVRTGLNYGTCVKYLNFMALLGWLVFLHEPTGHVLITETGRGFKRILLEGKYLPHNAMELRPVRILEKVS